MARAPQSSFLKGPAEYLDLTLLTEVNIVLRPHPSYPQTLSILTCVALTLT